MPAKLTLWESVSVAMIYCLYLLCSLLCGCLSYSVANEQAISLQKERERAKEGRKWPDAAVDIASAISWQTNMVCFSV